MVVEMDRRPVVGLLIHSGVQPRQLLESNQHEEGDRFLTHSLSWLAGCRDLLPKGMDS